MIDTKQVITRQNLINKSNCINIDNLFDFYDNLNKDLSHRTTNDDICTPMECVKKMIEYIPKDFWNKENIKVLDPCAGNGNFGAYCMTKTSIDNIWFNELSKLRYENCKNILNPVHIDNKDFFTIKDNKWDLIMANPPYSGGR